jgi:threonine dehydrogenase-like Zn-dependent dehydrogenase
MLGRLATTWLHCDGTLVHQPILRTPSQRLCSLYSGETFGLLRSSRRRGAPRYPSSDTQRLAFCQDEIAVDHAFDVSSDIDERLNAATVGDFFDIVLDATGSPKAMMRGLSYVAHGGTYVLLSIVRANITFNAPEFHKRETSLLGSRNATRHDFEMVLDAMRTGRVPVAALASHRSSLDEAPDRVPAWSTPEAGVIKALVDL